MFDLNEVFEGRTQIQTSDGQHHRIVVAHVVQTMDAVPIVFIDNTGKYWNWSNILWVESIN